MQKIQNLLNQKCYLKKLEIRKFFDGIHDTWKINLLLTVTEDEIYFDFPEENDLTVCFENVGDLEISDMCWIAPHSVMIYDYAENQYENHQRFQLEEQENMLNFFFENAKILS